MQISSINNNSPSFSKKLVARGAYVDNGSIGDCSIYRLEKNEDRSYFRDLADNFAAWRHAAFFNSYLFRFNRKNDVYIDKTYVVENDDNFTLGYYTVFNDKKGGIELDLIETYSNLSKDNSKKYIGESMIAYLAARAKNENSPYISAKCILHDAMNFYLKNNFEIIEKENILANNGVLYPQNYDNVLTKNELHTGKKIALIG